jgi:purine nucleosidase
MGGVTHPLVIGKETLGELNFSCDPDATHVVLQSPAKTTIITGNLCLEAFFGPSEILRLKEPGAIGIYDYILARVNPWVEFMGEIFNIDGFYNWDMMAAVYATNPALFPHQSVTVNSTVENLASGHLKIAGKEQTGYPLNIPTTITNISRFNDIVFDAWKNVPGVTNPETKEQFF